MQQSLQKEKFTEILLLTLAYLISLPYITHVYGGTINGLLNENLYAAVAVILFFSVLSFKPISLKYYSAFIPLIFVFLYNFISPSGELSTQNSIKYIIYCVIFFLVFRRIFNKEILIDIYVISMSVIFIYLLFFYFYVYFFPEDLVNYRVMGTYLDQDNVFERRTDGIIQ